MEPVKIVLRYVDGKVIKGYTQDFFPNKALFHFSSLDKEPQDKESEVYVKDLKAVFFVRDFNGNPEYNERKQYIEGEKPGGRKVEVVFFDDEMLAGSTMGYDPNRPGFFLFPVDPQSNNLRVFIITAAIKTFQYI